MTFGALDLIESVTLRNAVPGTDVSVSVVQSNFGPTYYGATLYYVDKLILSPAAYELTGAWHVFLFFVVWRGGALPLAPQLQAASRPIGHFTLHPAAGLSCPFFTPMLIRHKPPSQSNLSPSPVTTATYADLAQTVIQRPSFYRAIQALTSSPGHLKTLVDSPNQWEVKLRLQNTGDFAKGTFLAPSDAAFDAFLDELTVQGTTPPTVGHLDTPQLAPLTSRMLLHHLLIENLPERAWPGERRGFDTPVDKQSYPTVLAS